METKLMVRRGPIEVKVEFNFVMRGTVHPVRTASLVSRARDVLMADLDIPVVSLEDVYGGKLVAAMDRQHPRDLFDVMQLFAHEGITPGIRRAFVVYLACHNRPVHEVQFPAARGIALEYERTFQGMTADTVELAELQAVRERMMGELQSSLDPDERWFLLTLVANRPEWPLLGIPTKEHPRSSNCAHPTNGRLWHRRLLGQFCHRQAGIGLHCVENLAIDAVKISHICRRPAGPPTRWPAYAVGTVPRKRAWTRSRPGTSATGPSH